MRQRGSLEPCAPRGARTVLWGGSVNNGAPLPDFNRLIYRQPAATHVMEVAEDSLHGSGLWAKDLVIIDCSLTAQAGDLVVAQVGDIFVLARFERQQGVVLLTPENPAYQPMVVTQEQEPVCLFGVVTYVLHRVKRRRT